MLVLSPLTYCLSEDGLWMFVVCFFSFLSLWPWLWWLLTFSDSQSTSLAPTPRTLKPSKMISLSLSSVSSVFPLSPFPFPSNFPTVMPSLATSSAAPPSGSSLSLTSNCNHLPILLSTFQNPSLTAFSPPNIVPTILLSCCPFPLASL